MSIRQRKQVKEKRFERWLINVVAYIKGQQGVAFDLVSVGKRLGNHLIARCYFSAGLCEMHIIKRGKGAVLILLVQNKDTAIQVHQTLSGMHKLISRFANAKRKFVHRMEKLAQQLSQRFDASQDQFPENAYSVLGTFSQSCVALTGLEALFRERRHEPDVVSVKTSETKTSRAEKRYLVRYGAFGKVSGDPHSFYYSITEDEFVMLHPAEKGQNEDDESLSDLAQDSLETYIDVKLDSYGKSSDASTAHPADGGAVEAGDCGGLDLPDCGGFDVPDCSCDCSF